MKYVTAIQMVELTPGTSKGLSVAGKDILIANIDGSYYAVGKKCPHFWGDLSKGKLEGKIVTCPRHGSQFDVTNGKYLAGPAKKDLPVYPVKIDGDNIQIGL